MEGIGWVSFLVIGLLAGWIAEKVMSRSHGLLTNLAVGVIGAYLGAFIFDLVGLRATGGFIPALAVATVGAILLLAIVGWLRGRKRACLMNCPASAGSIFGGIPITSPADE